MLNVRAVLEAGRNGIDSGPGIWLECALNAGRLDRDATALGL